MRLRSFLLSAATAVLGGCIPTGACTLIGCHNGLAVLFDRPPTGAFRIEASVPNDPTQYAIDCADAATCQLLFPDLVAEQVTVRVILPQGTHTQQFEPRYEKLYPNGRRCGASCEQARVTIELPD